MRACEADVAPPAEGRADPRPQPVIVIETERVVPKPEDRHQQHRRRDHADRQRGQREAVAPHEPEPHQRICRHAAEDQRQPGRDQRDDDRVDEGAPEPDLAEAQMGGLVPQDVAERGLVVAERRQEQEPARAAGDLHVELE